MVGAATTGATAARFPTPRFQEETVSTGSSSSASSRVRYGVLVARDLDRSAALFSVAVLRTFVHAIDFVISFSYTL
jgi:hypothetical protein